MAIASRTWLATLTVFGMLSASLVANTAFAAAGHIVLDVDGVKRSALIVEHSRLKRVRRPVVIVLHGSKGDGARVRRNLGLDEMVENTGTVLVFPDAFEGHWSLGAGAKSDDAAFFRAIVTRLNGQGVIDPKRVFIVGVSTGGIMAMQIACKEPENYTGFATVIANMPTDLASTCAPSRPVPILMVNGTADPRMPYKGGSATNLDQVDQVASTDDTLGVFAKAATCGARLPEIGFPNRNPKSGSRAFLDKFEACKVPVELVRIEGGGHTIPGRWSGADSGAAVGAHNVDVDTAKLIFDFFKRLNGV